MEQNQRAKLEVPKDNVMVDPAKSEKAKPKRQRRWSFETVSKCPRCGSTDTVVRRTDSKKGRQYRLCQRAICRYRYSVTGKRILSKGIESLGAL